MYSSRPSFRDNKADNGRHFNPFLSHMQILGGILEKFKEKKQMVVVALRDAADAAYLSVSEWE